MRFAAEGATVVGCDINGAAAKETLAAVRDAGLDADIDSGDVDLGDPEQARLWVQGAAGSTDNSTLSTTMGRLRGSGRSPTSLSRTGVLRSVTNWTLFSS